MSKVDLERLGFVLIVVGIVAVLAGLLIGIRNTFRRQNQGGPQGLPEAFLEVLKAALAAPTEKLFFIGGIVLVILGLVLNGVQIFG